MASLRYPTDTDTDESDENNAEAELSAKVHETIAVTNKNLLLAKSISGCSKMTTIRDHDASSTAAMETAAAAIAAAPCSSSLSSSSYFRFLDLPLELRYRIYGYYHPLLSLSPVYIKTVSRRKVHCHRDDGHYQTALLVTSSCHHFTPAPIRDRSLAVIPRD